MRIQNFTLGAALVAASLLPLTAGTTTTRPAPQASSQVFHPQAPTRAHWGWGWGGWGGWGGYGGYGGYYPGYYYPW